jgi:hypothetical protein
VPESKELERCGRVKILYNVSGEDVILVLPQIEFHHLSLLTEIDLFQIHPKSVRGECRFKEINQTFLIRNCSPARRGDIRLIGSGDSVGDRYVANHAEYAGKSQVGALILGDRIDVKRCAGKAVSRAIGAG